MSLFGAVLLGLCLLALYTYFSRKNPKPTRSEDDTGISDEARQEIASLAERPKGADLGKKPALKGASAKRASATRASATRASEKPASETDSWFGLSGFNWNQ